MRIQLISDYDQLAALAPEWNRLAGDVPFRRWEWLGAWWRHYGPDRPPGTLAGAADHNILSPKGGTRALFVPAVYDPTGELVGLAPWRLERSASRGSTVAFLGSGEVCSDYLSLFCAPGREAEVAAALADWLIAARAGDVERRSPSWERLEFEGIVASDETMRMLLERLAQCGAVIDRRRAESCWRVTLPGSWEAYLAALSKSHRKQLRRFERRLFATGRARLHAATSEEELGRAFEILVDLHRRRRESLGDRGRFHDRRFIEFHRDVARQFFADGTLQLCWLELDGRPIASEYQIVGGQTVYAYQSGIDPAALGQEPGRLATLAALQAAIAAGHRSYDLLRGNEAYKAHWRARPTPCIDVRVLPGRGADWVRHGVWVARENVRTWAKAGWRWGKQKLTAEG